MTAFMVFMIFMAKNASRVPLTSRHQNDIILASKQKKERVDDFRSNYHAGRSVHQGRL